MFFDKFSFYLFVGVLLIFLPFCAQAESVQISGTYGNHVDDVTYQKVIVLTEMFLKENDYEVVKHKSLTRAVLYVSMDNAFYVIELRKIKDSKTISQEKRYVYNEKDLDVTIENLVNNVFEKKEEYSEKPSYENEVSAESSSSNSPASYWVYKSIDFGLSGNLLFPSFRHQEVVNVGFGIGWGICLGVNYAAEEYLTFPIIMNFADSKINDPQTHISFNAGIRYYWDPEYDFFVNPFIGISINNYNKYDMDDKNYDESMNLIGYNFGLEGGYRFVRRDALDMSFILSYEMTLNEESNKAKLSNTISALLQLSIVLGRK